MKHRDLAAHALAPTQRNIHECAITAILTEVGPWTTLTFPAAGAPSTVTVANVPVTDGAVMRVIVSPKTGGVAMIVRRVERAGRQERIGMFGWGGLGR